MKLLDWISQWTIVNKSEWESISYNLVEADKNIETLADQNRSLTFKLNSKSNQLKALKSKINSSNTLETYWNTKRPKADKGHKARDGVWIDVRAFYQKDYHLPTFKGSYDEIAEQALSWVIMNVKYVSDPKEFWQYSYETLNRKKGDCEDGAIVMANIMLMSGIPYWRVRLNCGDVKGGGHAWVTYLREKDDEWYCFDWCYWPNEVTGFRKKWKNAKKYFKIWYSWNEKFTFCDLPKLD
jgi:hypothetical protein